MGARAWIAWKIGVMGEGDDHGEKICVKEGWRGRQIVEWARYVPSCAMRIDQRRGTRKAVCVYVERPPMETGRCAICHAGVVGAKHRHWRACEVSKKRLGSLLKTGKEG